MGNEPQSIEERLKRYASQRQRDLGDCPGPDSVTRNLLLSEVRRQFRPARRRTGERRTGPLFWLAWATPLLMSAGLVWWALHRPVPEESAAVTIAVPEQAPGDPGFPSGQAASDLAAGAAPPPVERLAPPSPRLEPALPAEARSRQMTLEAAPGPPEPPVTSRSRTATADAVAQPAAAPAARPASVTGAVSVVRLTNALASPILSEFRVELSPGGIRLVDRDGSVFTGKAERVSRAGEASRTNLWLAGRSETLREEVAIEAEWFSLPAVSPSRLQAESNIASVSASGGLRLKGIARAGDRRIAIDASTASR